MIEHLKNKEVEHFHEWWERVAREDSVMVWKKAKDYGPLDLLVDVCVGLFAAGQPTLEHVLAFYAAGKLTRIVEALGRGDLPSEDCWRDLCCYAMIARRVRETKTWPA